MTLGRWVLVRRGHEHDRGLIAHELVHVRQWRELGAVRFLVRYLGALRGVGGTGWATRLRTRRSRSRPKRALPPGADDPFPSRSERATVTSSSARPGLDFPLRFLRSVSSRPEVAMADSPRTDTVESGAPDTE